MGENNLQNRSILENEIQLKDSQLENEADFKNGDLKKVDTEAEWKDIYLYSGQAMNRQELFQLSAHEDLKLVLVAGLFNSGKTTLETMLYHVFLEGKNQKLNFGGSYTIPGFKKRAEKIMRSSGEPEPVADRTLIGDKDWFLHLKVYDESGQDQNLIFADLSGEIFENAEYVKDYCEIFENIENVIVIIDGEKVCDVSKRRSAYTETSIMIRMLLNYGVITYNTKLQVVCTKLDKIRTSEDRVKVEQFLENKWKELLNLFENEVFSMIYIEVSALQIEEKSESEKLEEIIYNCMRSVPIRDKEMFQDDTLKRTRQFEYFGMGE